MHDWSIGVQWTEATVYKYGFLLVGEGGGAYFILLIRAK